MSLKEREKYQEKIEFLLGNSMIEIEWKMAG